MDTTEQQIVSPCVYSSFIFLTNAVLTFYFNYYIYSILFIILFLASVIHHSLDTFYTNIFDKISVYAVVFYGGYIFLNKYIQMPNLTKKELILVVTLILSFLATILLYIYGYFTYNFCFHEDINVRYMYHILMHFFASFGHHIIVLL